MTLTKKYRLVVTSILLTFLVFSLSFFLTLFDRGLYDKNFTENGIYDELGVQGVRSMVDYLIKYLTSEGVGQQGMDLFFPKEKEHLADVKILVLIVKYLTVAAIIGLLVLFYYSKNWLQLLMKSLLYAGLSAIVIMILITVLSLNFGSFWEGFHKVLFPQGNYSFPPDHLLIKLFPESFFRAFVTRMLLHAAVLSLVMLGSSYVIAQRKNSSKLFDSSQKD